MDSRTSSILDRQLLKLSINEYKNRADALTSNCIVNREGSWVKIKKLKLKKLKNYRHQIQKSTVLSNSMLWRAILRAINEEISTREHGPQRRRPI